jgi:hypothetical protein
VRVGNWASRRVRHRGPGPISAITSLTNSENASESARRSAKVQLHVPYSTTRSGIRQDAVRARSPARKPWCRKAPWVRIPLPRQLLLQRGRWTESVSDVRSLSARMLFLRTLLSGGTGNGAGARTADGASSSPVTGGPSGSQTAGRRHGAGDHCLPSNDTSGTQVRGSGGARYVTLGGRKPSGAGGEGSGVGR